MLCTISCNPAAQDRFEGARGEITDIWKGIKPPWHEVTKRLFFHFVIDIDQEDFNKCRNWEYLVNLRGKLSGQSINDVENPGKTNTFKPHRVENKSWLIPMNSKHWKRIPE